jgi:protease IV
VRANSLPPMSFAQMQELGEAIQKFKANHKKSIFYAENLDYGGKVFHYYFASFFGICFIKVLNLGKIYIAPPGFVSLVSLRLDQPFIKQLLEKIGIEPQLGKRKDYKTAANMFVEEKMTEAHKEMMDDLLRSLHDQLKNQISHHRQYVYFPSSFQFCFSIIYFN